LVAAFVPKASLRVQPLAGGKDAASTILVELFANQFKTRNSPSPVDFLPLVVS
jgi:hypothetical protein